MSTLDANRRTNTEHDFYQTLPCQIKCLCQFLNMNEQRVLDAGSGKQVITKQLKKSFPKIRLETSEINKKEPVTEDITFDFETRGTTYNNDFPVPTHGDFLKLNRRYNYIISNPPYSLKDDFIEHALAISIDVFMLFPLQVLNYIEFCEKWLDNNLYNGKILMYPKVILNQSGDYIQGGNTGYAWFHWSNTNPEDVVDNNKYEIIEDIRKYK